MEQPPSFVKDSNLVCQRKKYLYGLKQAPHALYEKINCSYINLGLKCCRFSNNVYVLHVHDDTLIIALYVNDLVITTNNVNLILSLKK